MHAHTADWFAAVDNPVYLAPEVLRKQPFTEKSDVYAFGFVLWQLINRTHFILLLL